VLHWTEHDHALLGQDRKHLVYVMFLEELLLTRDTIVPAAVMSKNGSVSKTKLVLHKWDKKSTLVRVGEDVVAAAVCNRMKTVVRRAYQDTRKIVASTFQTGAPAQLVEALGLAEEGDTAWPSLDGSLMEHTTVLSGAKRRLLANIWSFDPAKGDSVEGMSMDEGHTVEDRLADPTDQSTYAPFGPLAAKFLPAFSTVSNELFRWLQPPHHAPDWSEEEVDEAVTQRMSETWDHLTAPPKSLSWYVFNNTSGWDQLTQGTKHPDNGSWLKPPRDLTLPEYALKKVVNPTVFAALDMLMEPVGSGTTPAASLGFDGAARAYYTERVAFWHGHWQAVPDLLKAAWMDAHWLAELDAVQQADEASASPVSQADGQDEDLQMVDEASAGGNGSAAREVVEHTAAAGRKRAAAPPQKPLDVQGGGQTKEHTNLDGMPSFKFDLSRLNYPPRQPSEYAARQQARAYVAQDPVEALQNAATSHYKSLNGSGCSVTAKMRACFSAEQAFRVFVSVSMQVACMERLWKDGISKSIIKFLGCPWAAAAGLHLTDELLESRPQACPANTGEWIISADIFVGLCKQRAPGFGSAQDHPFPKALHRWSRYLFWRFMANNSDGLRMRMQMRCDTANVNIRHSHCRSASVTHSHTLSLPLPVSLSQPL
jgi:hypothetical protein